MSSMRMKVGLFQEMVGKCPELDNWRVFHMALCDVFYYVDSEKAMINEDNC